MRAANRIRARLSFKRLEKRRRGKRSGLLARKISITGCAPFLPDNIAASPILRHFELFFETRRSYKTFAFCPYRNARPTR